MTLDLHKIADQKLLLILLGSMNYGGFKVSCVRVAVGQILIQLSVDSPFRIYYNRCSLCSKSNVFGSFINILSKLKGFSDN